MAVVTVLLAIVVNYPGTDHLIKNVGYATAVICQIICKRYTFRVNEYVYNDYLPSRKFYEKRCRMNLQQLVCTILFWYFISYDATLMTSQPKNASAQWSGNLARGINWLMVITRVVCAIGVESRLSLNVHGAISNETQRSTLRHPGAFGAQRITQITFFFTLLCSKAGFLFVVFSTEF